MPTKLAKGDAAIAKVVERQMRNRELARGQRLAVGPPEREVVEHFICLSRQVGTGGSAVARRLGARLHWPVFDREVLEAMAGNDEVRRQIYESMDQRDLSWWEETLRSLMQGEFVRNDYFRRLCETLLSLARQGNCVFLGRGADLVLPSERGFRVRLVAPFSIRLDRYARDRSLPKDLAESQMKRVEAERSSFIRHHFGIDAQDPVRHDITINLARFSPDEAVEIILQAWSLRRIHR